MFCIRGKPQKLKKPKLKRPTSLQAQEIVINITVSMQNKVDFLTGSPVY